MRKSSGVFGLLLLAACSRDAIPVPPPAYQVSPVVTPVEGFVTDIAGDKNSRSFALSYSPPPVDGLPEMTIVSFEGKPIAKPEFTTDVFSSPMRVGAAFPNGYLAERFHVDYSTSISFVTAGGSTTELGRMMVNSAWLVPGQEPDTYGHVVGDHALEIRLLTLKKNGQNIATTVFGPLEPMLDRYILLNGFAANKGKGMVGMMRQEKVDGIWTSAVQIIPFSLMNPAQEEPIVISKTIGTSKGLEQGLDWVLKVIAVDNGFVAVLYQYSFPTPSPEADGITNSLFVRLDNEGKVLGTTIVASRVADIAWNGENLLAVEANQTTNSVIARRYALSESGTCREVQKLVVESGNLWPGCEPKVAAAGEVFGVTYNGKTLEQIRFTTVTPIRQ